MRTKLYNKILNRSLDDIATDVGLRNVRDFTYSNNNKHLNEKSEVEGYKKIVEYFWINAVTRLRENETNLGYINRINKRLSEIKETNKDLSGLCSHLIQRISKCKLE
jgi:hypothetical protein